MVKDDFRVRRAGFVALERPPTVPTKVLPTRKSHVEPALDGMKHIGELRRVKRSVGINTGSKRRRTQLVPRNIRTTQARLRFTQSLRVGVRRSVSGGGGNSGFGTHVLRGRRDEARRRGTGDR